jgi:multidrug efflux pump subunit AcrA (membrane-fusion protein)
LPLVASRGFAIPNNALVIRGDGIRVAVVDAKNQVHLKPVQLGRNYGVNVEVVDGLVGGERLVLNPADSLADGDEVSFSAADDDKPVAATAVGKAKTEARKEAP